MPLPLAKPAHPYAEPHATSAPGAYRLFITVRGANGKAATANLPFLVK
jgi:hypothetical protein